MTKRIMKSLLSLIVVLAVMQSGTVIYAAEMTTTSAATTAETQATTTETQATTTETQATTTTATTPTTEAATQAATTQTATTQTSLTPVTDMGQQGSTAKIETKNYADSKTYATVLNGVDYSAVYDFTYYSNKYADIKNTYGNDDVATLSHFVDHGMAEGRQANAAFDVTSYWNAYSDLRNAYGKNLTAYYMHYINYGKSEGRQATGVTELIGTTKLNGVDYSSVYDYSYYINKYQDIKKVYGNDDVAILAHFVNYGMAEGRQASVAFDITSYRNAYPELRNRYGKKLNAYYMHYINHGKSEGRKATGVSELVGSVTMLNDIDYSSVYDYTYYLAKYLDLAIYKMDDIALLQHFVDHGMAESRQASAAFDIISYRNAYSDLRNGYGKNLKAYYMHYINYGKSEGRQATGVTKLIGTTKLNGVDYSSVYDYTYYLTKYPDLAGFGDNDVSLLQHFVDHGMSEGRQANTAFDIISYYNAYSDLRNGYGKNLKLYYMHYINYGK